VGRTGFVVLASRVTLSTPKALQPRDGFLNGTVLYTYRANGIGNNFAIRYKVAGNLVPELAKVGCVGGNNI
jgi:hypothetical protein